MVLDNPEKDMYFSQIYESLLISVNRVNDTLRTMEECFNYPLNYFPMNSMGLPFKVTVFTSPDGAVCELLHDHYITNATIYFPKTDSYPHKPTSCTNKIDIIRDVMGNRVDKLSITKPGKVTVLPDWFLNLESWSGQPIERNQLIDRGIKPDEIVNIYKILASARIDHKETTRKMNELLKNPDQKISILLAQPIPGKPNITY